MFKNISKTVLLISLVSLFNDFSSEMLYPIMPLYLAQIGYGGLIIGVMEGIAELIAGFTKIYTGSLSDKMQRRLPFVNLGYVLSVLSRPLMVLSASVISVFAGRGLDKIGKGIRTAARDALLADECNENNRAEVFGFHRSFDTIGAICGPVFALLYLHYHPEDYKSVFFIAFIPGCLAVIISFLIKEKKKFQQVEISKINYSLKENFSFHKKAPKPLLVFFAFILGFALINSSDMFLLLRAKKMGMDDREVLTMYIFFNLVFALSAYPVGRIADRMKKKSILATGIIMYAVTYLIFAGVSDKIFFYVGFCLYGLYYAFSQGIIKALIIEQAGSKYKSSAIGFYEGINSICLLCANAAAGVISFHFGVHIMFYFTGFSALLIGISFYYYYSRQRSSA